MKPLKKTISRSLLKNLVLQNYQHRLNICGSEYYMTTDEMIACNIIVSFHIFRLLKYDRIFGKNLVHDTYGLK